MNKSKSSKDFNEFPSVKQSNRLFGCCLFISLVLGFLFNLTKSFIVYPNYDLFEILNQNLNSTLGTDSWGVMIQALKEIRSHPDVSVYQSLFFNQHVKFQYPLSSLLLFDIISRFDVGFEKIIIFINCLSVISSAMLALVCYFIYTNAFGIRRLRQQLSLSSNALLLIMSFMLVTLCYNLQFSLYIGQIQIFITLFVALSILAFQAKRFWLAGILIGLCCAIKPHWLVIIIWAALRRHYQMAWIAMLTSLFFFGLSIFFYGSDQVLSYKPVLIYLFQHGESFSHNQSVNGLVNRLLGNGNNLEWKDSSFPAFNQYVYFSTILSTALLLVFALFWRIKSSGVNSLALAFLCVTMASSIAWEHHYGIVIPIFALLIPALAVKFGSFNNATSVLVILSFVLTMQNLSVLSDFFANSHLNFLQSYVFFGALMVLYLLTRVIEMVEQ